MLPVTHAFKTRVNDYPNRNS